jgi:fatty acid desaturase
MARDADAVRITTAASSRNDDIARRQRRYVLSMAVRTACFVAAILVGPGWLRWVLVAGAVLLPYVAVVMANAVTTKSDGFSLIGTPGSHHELAPGSRSEPPGGPGAR